MKKSGGKTKIKKRAKILTDKRDIKVLPVSYTVTVSAFNYIQDKGK